MPSRDSAAAQPTPAASSSASSEPTAAPPPAPPRDQCETFIAEYEEHDRLMQRARACRRDSDCVEVLPVNLCSDCSVAVNRSSRYIPRLGALRTKYPTRSRCSRYACTETYFCGHFVSASASAASATHRRKSAIPNAAHRPGAA